MSEAGELFNALGQVVDENTSDSGIDVVNVIIIVIESLKADSDMTIESWEDFRQSINNMTAIANNLVDEEISRLKGDDVSS
jgi:hypothetical protein